MTGWDELRVFAPETLRAALVEIEREHSRFIDLPEPGSDRVERLRGLLQRTPLEDVAALAARLEREDLVAIADLLASTSDKVISHKAVRLGVSVRIVALVRRAWKLAVGIHPAPGLARLIAHSFREDLSGAVVAGGGESAVKRVAAWFSTDDLPLNLMRDLEKGDRRVEEWLESLPDLTTQIDSSSRLFESLRRRILTNGSADTLIRHRRELLTWVTELAARSQASLREEFAIHYVDALRAGRKWDEDVIDWMIESFKSPPDPDHLSDAWRRLDRASPGAVAELASWLALRRLEAFFADLEDPHRRFEFWRQHFADSFRHVEIVAGRQAALLHLPPVVVIEFAQVGNAAYVYPESELSWLRQIRSGFVDSYKRRSRLARRPSSGSEYRIIHVSGWQHRELPEMQILLRRRR